MECSTCKVQMQKGTLIGEGAWWRGDGVTTKLKTMFGTKVAGATSVAAYNCPKCGKIELKTESDNINQ